MAQHEGDPTADSNGIFSRVWLAIPDAAFRVVGVVVFLGYILWRLRTYGEYFPNGDAAATPDAAQRGANLARHVLIDLTYILIVAGFCLRVRPIRRATDPAHIMLAFVGAFWPFLPFVFGEIVAALDDSLARDWQRFMWRTPLSSGTAIAAAAIVLPGLLLEVWGYAYLVRSLSIVPEARVLKVTGPYRLVRHPIYLGQFLAQAGIWLVLANTHAIWIAFYAIFVGLQLVRTRMEDRVLAEAFGENYLQWKRRTFWFA